MSLGVYETKEYATSSLTVTKVFLIPQPASTWVLDHGMSTTGFKTTLLDVNKKEFFAPTRAPNKDQLVVTLSTPTAGYALVTFFKLPDLNPSLQGVL